MLSYIEEKSHYYLTIIRYITIQREDDFTVVRYVFKEGSKF